MITSDSFHVKFVIASHGRQGTISLQEGFSVLDKVHVPYYPQSDKALLTNNWSHLFNPIDEYSAQSMLPDLDYQQEYGLIHHSFANIHIQQIFNNLAQVISSKAPVFLFARNPYENLISCYNTYLVLFFCFHLREQPSDLSQLKLLDSSQPISFEEYLSTQAVLGNYPLQLNWYKRIGMNPFVTSFNKLNNMRQAIELILSESEICDSSTVNIPSHVMHTQNDQTIYCLFAPRNQFDLNGIKLQVGFFPTKKKSPFQMSFEIPIADSYYVTPMQWYKLPIKTREKILENPNIFDMIDITNHRYSEYKKNIQRAVEPWKLNMHDPSIKNTIDKEIGKSIRAFAQQYPSVSADIGLS